MFKNRSKRMWAGCALAMFAGFARMTTQAGIPQLVTSKEQSWDFIQSVGGMRVSMEGTTLTVDCDVSGLKTVTVKPTIINSGIGVRKLTYKRDGSTILLTLSTCVIGKGVKTSPGPVDLSAYPDGAYEVKYLDRDGARHSIGKIAVKKESVKPAGITAEEAAGTVSYSPMLMMSSVSPGHFSGARFPAEELRHLNELLAKGVVIEDEDPLRSKDGLLPFYSYRLGSAFTFADTSYVAVEILALKKHSSWVDLRHVVMLFTGQQRGRKVVYTRNPELVAYVLSNDFRKKLLAWNSDMKEKIEPFGQMKLTLSPLDNLVYVDPSTAAPQHPLVCGEGRDFPDGHEMLFRNKATGATIHAVFPADVKPPKNLDGAFTLHGEFQTIKKWDAYGAKNPRGSYTYFVVASYESDSGK